MKKILLLMLSVLGITQAMAQDYEYVPFVREGVKWEYTYWSSIAGENFTLEMKGDVTIDGKTYKMMHKYSGEGINWENDTVPVYLREEDRVVYGIVPDGKTYDECPIGNEDDVEMMELIASGKEFVLYDFNDAVSFIGSWCIMPDNMSCKVITDQVTISGGKTKRYISHCCTGDFCMIEGIGYDGLYFGYPLALQYNVANPVSLDCVIENGEVIYRSERYKMPKNGVLENILPLAREGVQWVNEHVVIDHGEISRSYYTYEFKGTNLLGHPICYVYTDETLDMETASLAAVFKVEDGYGESSKALRQYYIYDNEAYETVLDEGRNLMSYISFYGWQPLYKFSETYSDIELFNTVNYHIIYQNKEFLNRENFFEVDPVEIEGMECRRYAYVGEDGEPIAYITEGIGFDSRDMGDLLTPFTRRPDPDADYQEYWGLSHVIKDGKIIYKGMRYREDVPAELSGDVNGDGAVNIADVTALIDLLLSGNSELRAPSDLDSNGRLTIEDVTLLIDRLLTGE